MLRVWANVCCCCGGVRVLGVLSGWSRYWGVLRRVSADLWDGLLVNVFGNIEGGEVASLG